MPSAQLVHDLFSFYIIILTAALLVSPLEIFALFNKIIAQVPIAKDHLEPFPTEHIDGGMEFGACMAFIVGVVYAVNLGDEQFRRRSVWTRFAAVAAFGVSVYLQRIPNSFLVFCVQDGGFSLLMLCLNYLEPSKAKKNNDKVE